MSTDELSEAETYEIVERISRLKKNPRSVFISYTWDSDDHKQWVRGLADQLSQTGFEVILDQTEQTDWARVLMYGIWGCNNIVFVSTETVAERSGALGESSQDGVFFDERQMLNKNFHLTQKVVTLYRSGIHCSNCYPIVDFGEGGDYGKSFIILVLFLLSPWKNKGTFGSPVFLDTEKEMTEYKPGERINVHFVPLEEYPRAHCFSGVEFIRY